MDGVDRVAVLAVGLVTVAAVAGAELLLLAAVLAGFVLSIAIWRLRQGRGREAAGWLALTVAAVVLPFDPLGRPLALAAFLTAVIAGAALVARGRLAPRPADAAGEPTEE